jgi:hypothetical protein
MQTHVSEAADPEGNLSARFAQESRVQKMLFKVGSIVDDGEQGPVPGHIFRGTSSGRVPWHRDKL